MYYCIFSFIAVTVGLYLWLDNRIVMPQETPKQKSQRILRRNIGIALLIGGAVLWAWMYFSKQKATFDIGDPDRDYFTAEDVYRWREEENDDTDPTLRALLQDIDVQQAENPNITDFMQQRRAQRLEQLRTTGRVGSISAGRSPARRMAQQ